MGSVAPAEGLSVAGKYRLVRPLARGSMGEVWIASHETLGGELAIKFMTRQEGPDNEDPETAMARFQFEAQVAARLSRRSRHIVAVTDHGQEWGQAYLVMEFVEGESLADVVHRQAPLELSLVATLVTQLAKGLSQAHAEGLFHRDLKPANVLLTRDEDGGVLAKILDFGIAKATRRHQIAPSTSNIPVASGTRPGVGHETEQGVVLGTPNYMSPEQARGLASLDQRCDVWALGVIAYEALTGALPYDGETTADLLVNICTTRSLPARTFNDGLPDLVEPFFLKAFAPRVNDRFQTAFELAEALMTVARETSHIPKVVTVPPPPPVPPAGVRASTDRSDKVPPASSARVEIVDKPTARTFTTGAAAAVPMQARWGLWGALALLVVVGIVVGIKVGGSSSGVTADPSSASTTKTEPTHAAPSVAPPPPSAAVLPVEPSSTVAGKTSASTKQTVAPKGTGKGPVPTAPTSVAPTGTAPPTPTPSVTAPPPPTTTATTPKPVDKGEIL